MSLVANYSSGSDSESDNDQQKTIKPSRSFADSLPPPKRKVDVSTGKVQIFVDLPKLDDKDLDTSSTTTAPSIKRQKTSNGSGLSSLLPAPKNKNPSIKKETQAAPSTTFIPPALARRKAEIQAAKAASAQNADKEKPKVIEKPVETVNEDQENDEESDDEPAGEITSFFPLGPNITHVSTSSKEFEPTSSTIASEQAEPEQTAEPTANITYTAADAYAYYDPNMHYDPVAYQQWYEQQAAYAQYEEQEQNFNAQEELSGEALERLMGRHGRELGGNVNIKTVNLAEELQNKDGIPTQEPIRHSGSSIKTSAIQKRKSNLMYLAHQAQDRRDILAEQYAQNRKTKREAKMKYGKE
ncbi:hypothetical protein Unana1_07293 [Umbelopsis nana]